ncbi:putative G-protein coupled receptor 160 [Astyanax mexicanus]|uniref:Putative G-protein coupled receptor 160 n=1 Tax=Astyanax mexicanus TaxID=7994 RepID=A0A8T2LKH8_ASTMX|nr:putative G-protein coupled receptor 160 [Astyanax mexicanus]
MLLHHSTGSMIAVLQEMEENGTCTHNETLQYLFLMLSKVALNTLVLSFWLRSITRSFLGIFSISIYLADLVLIGCISWIWWFRENLDIHKSMCFTLAHSSSVYSMLPLPVLLVGTLDYAYVRHMAVPQNSPSRTASHCMAVVLVWTLACFYSLWYTNSELLTIQYNEEINALVCPVHGSAVVSYFNFSLSIVASAVLLLHCRGISHWVRLVNKLNSRKSWPFTPRSDIAFSNMAEKLKERTAGELCTDDDQQSRPPLLVSLTLCFVFNWTPYLIMSVACDLLGFAVPAYATVNLLWMACANSLITGLAFWYSSDELGPFCKLPDDICAWSFYWHLSKEDCQWSTSKKHNRLSICSERLLHQV